MLTYLRARTSPYVHANSHIHMHSGQHSSTQTYTQRFKHTHETISLKMCMSLRHGYPRRKTQGRKRHLVFETSAFTAALRRRRPVMAKADRETISRVSGCPFSPNTAVCATEAAGWVSKLLLPQSGSRQQQPPPKNGSRTNTKQNIVDSLVRV